MGHFASARVENILRDSGAFRVSAGAIDALNEILSDKGLQVAKKAVEIANHSGRKTIRASDIKLALDRMS